MLTPPYRLRHSGFVPVYFMSTCCIRCFKVRYAKGKEKRKKKKKGKEKEKEIEVIRKKVIKKRGLRCEYCT